MSMGITDQEYIESQLRKRWPDLERQFPTNTEHGDTLYQECYRMYNLLDGEPRDWVLEELREYNVDPSTFCITRWVWRRRS